jgi:hypothetical protein
MVSWPLNLTLSGRSFGSRSRQRMVFSSSSVKSSVNQPETAWPWIWRVVRRLANSGRSATSVVWEISFSWRTTKWPSLVTTRSGSMKSAPSAMASRKAISVLSGRSPLAPRWPMISGFFLKPP